MNAKKIGLLIGGEKDWPLAFLHEVNRRQQHVGAELLQLSGTRMAAACEYAVIIDRMSHEVPYYRTVLKVALLAGTSVINNPLLGSAYDRFFNASLVTHLGLHHPRTVALPAHSYRENIFEDSLRNLSYPIPWKQHIDYLGGFPVVLRPLRDSVLLRVYVVDTYEELWQAYDQSGPQPMMLREHIPWEKYVRCICVGPEMLIARYIPGSSGTTRYYHQPDYLTASEQARVQEQARLINTALGFDFNMIDFAVQGDTLYAVDVTNPVPNLDIGVLTPFFFDWVVKKLAAYAIDLAHGEQQQTRDFRWASLLHDAVALSEG